MELTRIDYEPPGPWTYGIVWVAWFLMQASIEGVSATTFGVATMAASFVAVYAVTVEVARVLGGWIRGALGIEVTSAQGLRVLHPSAPPQVTFITPAATGAPTCLYCSEEAASPEIFCSSCDAPYHPSCARDAEWSCSRYACGGRVEIKGRLAAS